jgi:hypothetical protein
MNQAKSQEALPEFLAMHFTNAAIGGVVTGFSA